MGHFQPTSASAGGSGFWLFSAWPAFPWASLKLNQRQLPIQRLILIFFIEATTVLDIITTVATLTTATTARDLLTLSLPLLLMPRLIPGTDTTVDLHTTATATHTTDMAMATATTGASKKGISNPELASMKCQHFRRRPA